HYQKAQALQAQYEYGKAIKTYELTGSYKDASEQIELCRQGIAKHEREEEEHRLAIRQAEAATIAKVKKRANIIVCVIAFVMVAIVVAALIYTKVIQPKQKYDAASALLANGQYDEAFAAFSEIESYGDVKAIIQNDENLAAAAFEAKFTVGNTMTFGSYEQDNNTSNGAEAIEWLVLAREGDRALVISVDGLDCVQYHTKHTATTWETSTLRTWMNDTFL
ncbi:MAG: DUF6273 domain-containing protein, partial [Clostridia bacterium]